MRVWTIIFVSGAATVAALVQDDAHGFALLLARAAFVLLLFVALLYGARVLTLQMAEAFEACAPRARSGAEQRAAGDCAATRTTNGRSRR